MLTFLWLIIGLPLWQALPLALAFYGAGALFLWTRP
jgi:hypothetical protein